MKCVIAACLSKQGIYRTVFNLEKKTSTGRFVFVHLFPFWEDGRFLTQVKSNSYNIHLIIEAPLSNGHGYHTLCFKHAPFWYDLKCVERYVKPNKIRKCACYARYVPLQVMKLQVGYHYYNVYFVSYRSKPIM